LPFRWVVITNYVPRPVVSPVTIQVAAMCPWCILVHTIAQIPLVGETVGRVEMAIQWLVNHLISTRRLAI
jgi:hypothetical protein